MKAKPIWFIVFCLGPWGGAQAVCIADTIIIDGQPLELELDILQGQADAEGPGLEPDRTIGKTRKWKGQGPDVLLGFGAGVAVQPQNAKGEHLARFLGKGARPLPTLRAAMEWRNGPSFFRLQGAVDLSTDWAFDATALDDSIYGLAADGAGGLEQWISRTYELGIELDTLPLPVAQYTVTSGMLGFNFGGSRSKRAFQGGDFRWWAGFHYRMTRSSRGASDVNRVASSGLPSAADVTGNARQDWDPAQHGALGIQAGASGRLGHPNWHWLLVGQWTAGSQSRWAMTAGLGYRLRQSRR